MTRALVNDDEIGPIIGANLKRERRKIGLTQGEFADSIGQSRSYVVQVENGYVKTPGVLPVYVWATALGVRMEDLMSMPRVEHTTKGRSRARRAAKDNGTK